MNDRLATQCLPGQDCNECRIAGPNGKGHSNSCSLRAADPSARRQPSQERKNLQAVQSKEVRYSEVPMLLAPADARQTRSTVRRAHGMSTDRCDLLADFQRGHLVT